MGVGPEAAHPPPKTSEGLPGFRVLKTDLRVPWRWVGRQTGMQASWHSLSLLPRSKADRKAVTQSVTQSVSQADRLAGMRSAWCPGPGQAYSQAFIYADRQAGRERLRPSYW